MQLTDSVVLDEVAKVMKLVESISAEAAGAKPDGLLPAEPTSSVPVTAASSGSATSPLKIHVALLAGELHLEVSLLQELKYRLRGTAASVRIAPSMSRDQNWGIDFDVGGQRHCFINTSANEKHEQNILDVPPINGHVGLQIEPEAMSVEFGMSMERVDIDATAIQGVVSVMSQPEAAEFWFRPEIIVQLLRRQRAHLSTSAVLRSHGKRLTIDPAAGLHEVADEASIV